MLLFMISEGVLALEALVAAGLRALVGSVITVALVVVLQVVADHKGLAAATLLALVRPLVGMRPHVLLEVALSGELFSALRSVAVEGVPGVEPGMGVQAVQGRKGIVASLHLTHERFLAGVDTDMDLMNAK